MKRALTGLEKKVLSNNIGRQEKRFLVCAVYQLGKEHSSVDSFKFCIERNRLPKLKKELKTEFPKDDVVVLVIKARRIE